MDIFLRFAAETDHLPNPFFTKAYDARILYILSGEGEIRFPEKKFPLREGTLCYYPSGQAYWPVSSAENKLRFITLNFDLTGEHKEKTAVLAPVAAEDFLEEKSLPTHHNIEHELYKSYFVLSDAHFLREDLLSVSNLFNNVHTHGKQAASARLCSLLYTLLDHAETQACVALSRAISYVDEHYRSILSNDEIGQALHYHPYYLNRLFRRHMGKTLHRYLVETRLRNAARLLTETALSVADIAEAVGFENADHFSNCFSRFYGTPPTKFRRASRLI